MVQFVDAQSSVFLLEVVAVVLGKDGVPRVHLADDVCGAFQVLYQGLDFPQLFRVVHVGDVDLDLLSVARKMLLSGIEPGTLTNSFFSPQPPHSAGKCDVIGPKNHVPMGTKVGKVTNKL